MLGSAKRVLSFALAAVALAMPCAAQPATPRARVAPTEPIRFIADPVADGAVVSLSVGFAALLEIIIQTGELAPNQPTETDALIDMDRAAVVQTPSKDWGLVSNAGIGTALAFALADTVETGISEGGESGWVDAVMYAESATVTWAATNLVKLAVRRPRPVAYAERDERAKQGLPPIDVTETDRALSFWSGHAAITAALSTTATYLAFARHDDPLRGWLTLGGGAAITGLVATGRVRSGKHFPTDVYAGMAAGIGIGAMVPHLHRAGRAEDRKVWIGMGPGDGAGLSVLGSF